MKVSILIPVYNVERHIEQCAVSLFEQTYADIQYVFVDDCSTDASLAVLRSVVDRYPQRKPHVRIISLERNSGVGFVRQTALDAAEGTYIMFADSDDWLPLDAVESLVARQQETDADIVDGAYRKIYSQNQSHVVLPYICSDASYLKIALCQFVVSSAVWGRLYKRSLIERLNIRFAPGIDNAEDLLFTLKLFLHAKRATLSSVVYCYRADNANSYTNSASMKNTISYLKANQLLLDYYAAHDTQRTYDRALQLGMLNVLRLMRRRGVSRGEVEKHFSYHPHGLFCRLCAWAIKGGLPISLADILYRILRNIHIALWRKK